MTCLAGVVFLWRLRVAKKQKPIQSPTFESKISREQNSYTYFSEKIDLGSAVYVEKPKAAYGLDSSSLESNAGWTPQVTTYRGVQMSPKQVKAIQSSPKKYAKWEKALQLQVNFERSPPPYVDPSRVPLPPTPPESAKRIPPTPPTPPATNKSRALLPGPPLEPLPSPLRSTSFASQMDKPNQIAGKEMTVANLFTPSMDDELAIAIGETVRLVEEYQDGWCLIQRLGEDSQRGVVPHFCLMDQPFSHSLGSNYL